ncbi:type III CRISPR-associated RAMP protein Csx7 [Anaerosporobacter sp.]|uniref:type III CRISPR-associated RAMP protein Csx7 n=1 Tax=Anaerosporobacter sp. TaxID=1872529 RepID=UPI00286FA0C2|nr:CRISPR-associated RAMP protein Csx7 [Anaerosporobacter sp.]
MTFETFNKKHIIKGEFLTIDPIHIGASNNDPLDPTAFDNPVLKDQKGNPIIPGSSIKGVVRSYFEAVLRGIEKEVCNIFEVNDSRCITKSDARDLKKKYKENPTELANQLYKKSCVVCQLFGGREVAGKLQFKDSCYIGEQIIYEKRDGVGIDRNTGAARRGAKYDFEIVPKGSRFDFYMIAENLDEEQEKYLEFIKRYLQSGDMSIGGKSTRGLGRIKLVKIDDSEKRDIEWLKQQLGM